MGRKPKAKPRAAKNPKRAVKSESNDLLTAAPLLWHHVEAGRKDLIERAKGVSRGTKNLLISACPKLDDDGKPIADKSLEVWRRKIGEAAIDLQLKVAVNRANNEPTDILAIQREAQVKDAEITAMIEALERAKAENFPKSDTK